jgi:hypothetical protein
MHFLFILLSNVGGFRGWFLLLHSEIPTFFIFLSVSSSKILESSHLSWQIGKKQRESHVGSCLGQGFHVIVQNSTMRSHLAAREARKGILVTSMEGKGFISLCCR